MCKSEKKEYKIALYLQVISLIAIISVIVTIGFYYVNFYLEYTINEKISKNANDWSEFGSYIGGALSPILAFLALIALLYSIHIQTKELSLSVEELRKSAEAFDNQNKLIRTQAFEATFFQMLKLLSELIQTIKIHGKTNYENVVLQGRDAMQRLYGEFSSHFFNEACNNQSDAFKANRYSDFYKIHDHQIGHYYRIIYNILKLVSNQHYMPYSEQRIYTDILRAQLSKYELALAFYNVVYFQGNSKGQGKGNMYHYVMKYNIFKHLELELILKSERPKFEKIMSDYRTYRDSIDKNH